jgi:copper(I)-binding protein
MLRSIAVSALVIFVTVAGARSQTSTIDADHVWARETPNGAKTAAVYMTLTNKGTSDDRLVAISTSIAGKAGVHTTTTDNGIMRMRPVAALDVKPGTVTVLKPGGSHVMLMELKEPLVAGQKFTLSLTFERAGKVDVTGVVEKGDAIGSHDAHGMKM